MLLLTNYRFIDRFTFHYRNDHKSSGPSEWNENLSDTFKLKSHFLFSLCQLTHSISSSHAPHKQNKKLHTFNHINKSQYNLSKSSHTACLRSYFLSDSVYYNTNSSKNTMSILTHYRFIDRITFHYRNDHKSSGPSEWNKNWLDTFKLKSHFFFSLCQLTHSISSFHAPYKQNKTLHSFNHINKSQK